MSDGRFSYPEANLKEEAARGGGGAFFYLPLFFELSHNAAVIYGEPGRKFPLCILVYEWIQRISCTSMKAIMF